MGNDIGNPIVLVFDCISLGTHEIQTGDEVKLKNVLKRLSKIINTPVSKIANALYNIAKRSTSRKNMSKRYFDQIYQSPDLILFNKNIIKRNEMMKHEILNIAQKNLNMYKRLLKCKKSNYSENSQHNIKR